ncbi:phosphatidylinositol kinase [Cohnella suwonensis]|uniref:Phosphatidylinositol kinase n=1 Tax=Cohnella suwonensis TaxID=696072 RepID=A0ABW0M300_9BACL
MFPVIDISKWFYEDIFVSGSKEKRWYRTPEENQLRLFKLPVSLTSGTNPEGESTGEMWAEKIASEVGNTVGLETHQVDIGYLHVDPLVLEHYGLSHEFLGTGIYGALCKSFLNEGEEVLIEGADMIMDFDVTYDRKKLRGNTEIYRYDLLNRLFNKHGFESKLHEMILLDAILGNTDRHQDNFGIIRNERNKEIRMAPIYDNSSSLGRELPVERIKQLLSSQEMFDSYIRRSKTLIKIGSIDNIKKVSCIDLLGHALEQKPQIKNLIQKLEQLTDEDTNNIVQNVPDEVMSEVQKEFVSRILRTRRDIILREFLL